MDKEVVDVFEMERKLGKEPRPVLVKFESQTSNNLILENASKLKNSEVFKKVIFSQDLSKQDREECNKKWLQNERSSIQRVGNTNEGQPGSFHAIVHRRNEAQ